MLGKTLTTKINILNQTSIRINCTEMNKKKVINRWTLVFKRSFNLKLIVQRKKFNSNFCSCSFASLLIFLLGVCSSSSPDTDEILASKAPDTSCIISEEGHTFVCTSAYFLLIYVQSFSLFLAQDSGLAQGCSECTFSWIVCEETWNVTFCTHAF